MKTQIHTKYCCEHKLKELFEKETTFPFLISLKSFKFTAA